MLRNSGKQNHKSILPAIFFTLLVLVGLYSFKPDRKGCIKFPSRSFEYCMRYEYLVLDADSFKRFEKLNTNINQGSYANIEGYLNDMLADIEKKKTSGINLRDTIWHLIDLKNFLAQRDSNCYNLNRVEQEIRTIKRKIHKNKTLNIEKKNSLKRYLLYWTSATIGRELWFFHPQLCFSCDIDYEDSMFNVIMFDVSNDSTGIQGDSILYGIHLYKTAIILGNDFPNYTRVLQKEFAGKCLNKIRGIPGSSDARLRYQEKVLRKILNDVYQGHAVMYRFNWMTS